MEHLPPQVSVKSGFPTKYGEIAQLVEQRPEQSCVSGSIPLFTTSNKVLEIRQFKKKVKKV
jgi:hypothetical protein